MTLAMAALSSLVENHNRQLNHLLNMLLFVQPHIIFLPSLYTSSFSQSFSFSFLLFLCNFTVLTLLVSLSFSLSRHTHAHTHAHTHTHTHSPCLQPQSVSVVIPFSFCLSLFLSQSFHLCISPPSSLSLPFYLSDCDSQ